MIQPAPIPQELRAQIARITGVTRRGAGQPVAFNLPAIDRLLPGGGLARSGIHEVVGDQGAVTAFLVALLAQQADVKQVLWVTSDATLFAPGVSQLGLNHRRLVMAWARHADDRLWAAEEGLKELSYGVVVVETSSPDLTETRRLQLAAEASGSIGFLIRRDRQPSSALTRWQIEPAYSQNGQPLWRISLERVRGAESGGSWILGLNDAAVSFSLFPEMANGSAEAAE